MAYSPNGKAGPSNGTSPLSGVKLLIGIPTRGTCSIDFAKSLSMSVALLVEAKVTVSIQDIRGSCFVEMSRNSILAQFIKGDYTHCLMIDDDMGWSPELPIKMILENKGFIASIGPKKNETEEYACELLTNPDGTPQQEDGLLIAARVGAAFVLFKRQVIKTMFEKFPDLQCLAIDAKFGYMLFDKGYNRNQFLTEDYTFCERFREMGGKIWIYPDADFIHTGVKDYKGNLQKYLLKIPPVKKESFEGIKHSIIIVAYKGKEDIELALNSLCDHKPVDESEVIIIDNSPEKLELKSLERLESHYKVTRVFDGVNHGFAEGCNIGARLAKGKNLIFMNPDTVVFKGWAEGLESHIEEDTGAIGPISNYVAGLQKVEWYKKLDKEEKCEELADYFLNRGVHKSIPAELLIGFFLMVPKKVWDKVGEFDKAFLFGCDDLEYSLRIKKAGYKLKIAADVFVYHKGHVSANANEGIQEWEETSANHMHEILERDYPGKTSMELWGCNIFKTKADT